MAGASSGAAGLAALGKEIDEVIQRLRAFVADFEEHQLPEYELRKQQLAALTGSARATPSPPAPRPARPARGRARRAASPNGNRSGRDGQRSDQALQIVNDNPGIKIPAIAKMMGIEANYLYRVMPNLEKTGKVTRDEQNGWHLVPGALEGLAPDPGRVAELAAAASTA